MRRREFIASPFWVLLSSSDARSQAQRWRIGILAAQQLPPLKRFALKLRELGYVDGANVSIQAGLSEGQDERYPSLARELISHGVDIIITWGTPAALAAKGLTERVPVVIVAGDVLNTGIVANLAHPGGNVTGFSTMNVELEAKRLELLREMVPSLTRLSVLLNPRNPLNRVNFETVQRFAAEWGIELNIAEASDRAQVDAALLAAAATKPDAALIAPDTMLLSERPKILAFMARNRIPAMYPFREYAEDGGLVAHGANLSVLFERAAFYVDRIFKGAKPGDLPVEQATAFELIINLNTAKALGLTVPPTLLARADEVIE